MGYQAIYKCRMCHTTYNGSYTGNKTIVVRTLDYACTGIASQEPQSPRMIEPHFCENGSMGIGDFIGFHYQNEIQDDVKWNKYTDMKPDSDGIYLVTATNGDDVYVDIMQYTKATDMWGAGFNYINEGIIAWAPQPEVYKEL